MHDIYRPICQYFSPFFFSNDLRNNKQAIKKPKAANPPTARATVFCVSCCPSDPDPIKHIRFIIIRVLCLETCTQQQP